MTHPIPFAVTVQRGTHRFIVENDTIRDAIESAKRAATEYSNLHIGDRLFVSIREQGVDLVAIREYTDAEGVYGVAVGAIGPKEERRLKELGVEVTDGPIVTGQLFALTVKTPLSSLTNLVGSEIVLPGGIRGRVDNIIQQNSHSFSIGIVQEGGEQVFVLINS